MTLILDVISNLASIIGAIFAFLVWINHLHSLRRAQIRNLVVLSAELSELAYFEIEEKDANLKLEKARKRERANKRLNECALEILHSYYIDLFGIRLIKLHKANALDLAEAEIKRWWTKFPEINGYGV